MQHKLLAGCAALLFSSLVSAQTLTSLDGVGVTADELEQAMKAIVPENQHESLMMKEKSVRSFMETLLTQKAMAAKAVEFGLDQQPVVRARLDFERNKLLAATLIDDYVDKAKEPDLDVLAKELYLTNKSEFKTQEQVEARHILIEVNAERDEQAALAKAQDIAAKAKKDPDSFVGLALEHSDDPSAQRNGGNLGFFTRGTMVKPFSDAAFAMKKDTISAPVKSDFGYHIIQLLDRKPATDLKFEDVKAQLIEEARANFRSSKRREIVSAFQEHEDIQVDEAALEAFMEKIQQPYRKK